MQIISERGGGQPQRRGDSSKRAHVDLTLCGPARGSMMPMHWAFAGTKNLHDFCKGTDHTWDLTAKGWSTLTSWLVWAREFVKHMKSKGLTKALIFCDNASLHMAEEVIEIFAKGVWMFGIGRARAQEANVNVLYDEHHRLPGQTVRPVVLYEAGMVCGDNVAESGSVTPE